MSIADGLRTDHHVLKNGPLLFNKNRIIAQQLRQRADRELQDRLANMTTMSTAATLHYQIEAALANRTPSTLTQAPRIIRAVAAIPVGQSTLGRGYGLEISSHEFH